MKIKKKKKTITWQRQWSSGIVESGMRDCNCRIKTPQITLLENYTRFILLETHLIVAYNKIFDIKYLG